jgi:hypothetical protein
VSLERIVVISPTSQEQQSTRRWLAGRLPIRGRQRP